MDTPLASIGALSSSSSNPDPTSDLRTTWQFRAFGMCGSDRGVRAPGSAAREAEPAISA